MVRDDFLGKIKIIVIIAIIFGVMGALFYLFYGFAFLWQAMAATFYIIIISIIAILFLSLSIYLWIKSLLLKRELNKSKNEIKTLSINLEKCYADLNKVKLEQMDEEE